MSIKLMELMDEDFNEIWQYDLPWESLNDKRIMVAGATGLVGTCLIYAIAHRNTHHNSNIKVVALARNEELLKQKFSDIENVEILPADVCEKIRCEGELDYIVHAACDVARRTHEKNPILAMKVFTDGTMNICELAVEKNSKIILFSSVAIYGRSDERKPFEEDDIYYIDLTSNSYSYCEGKRISEMICACYSKQFGMDFSTLRLEKAYGPTMNPGDRSILPYFITVAASGSDIELKSDGTQQYNYVYVADAVSAVFFIMLKGQKAAYNCGMGEGEKVQRFGDIVQNVTDYNHVKLIRTVNQTVNVDNPGSDYSAMYSKPLLQLGWKKLTNMESGIEKTSRMIKELYGDRLKEFI